MTLSYKDIIEAVNCLETKIDQRFNKIEDEFVRKSDFNLVRTIVFTMCGIILIAFLNNLISFNKGERTSVFSMDVIPTSIVKQIGETIVSVR